MSGDTTRRGFLAKLGAMATAPVLTAYAADEQTGLALPSRDIQVARELPPPLIISSSPRTMPIPVYMDDEEWPHERMHRGDGTLVFLVDGQPWMVPAFRMPVPGDGKARP